MTTTYVNSGESSTGLILTSDSLFVNSGGTAINTTLSGVDEHLHGFMLVDFGGSADKTTVNTNGQMNISAGAIVTAVKENGGCVNLSPGASATFVSNVFSGLIEWGATVHSGTTAYQTTVPYGCDLYVYEGGLASRTTVESGGRVTIISGGTTVDTTLSSGGRVLISSGGKMNGVTVLSSGSVSVKSGGSLQNIVVSSGGSLYVSSGATATNVTLSGGKLLAVDGATIEGFTNKNGKVYADEGATIISKGKTSSSSKLEVSSDCDDNLNNYLYAKKMKPQLNPYVYSANAQDITSKTKGVLVDKSGTVSHEGKSNYVGYGDDADFTKITLTCGARLVFNVEATGQAKFTIWSLTVSGYDRKGNPKYKMKSLQTVTLKKGQSEVETLKKAPLLAAGDYYISVEAVKPKKGGNAYYNVSVSSDSVFYAKGKNYDDDWINFVKEDYSGLAHLGVLTASKKNVLSDWVGFGDLTDYKKFKLTTGAKLSFAVTATDAASISIVRIDSKKKKENVTTLSEKKLWTGKLKKRGDGDYFIVTKPVLLEAGDYYLCVTSTNGKKGGSADYNVVQNEAECVYFTKGNNNDDWTDMAEKGAAGKVGSIGNVDGKKEKLLEDWVGFGDAADYKKFTLATAAKVDFAIISSDVVKFSVCQLESKTDKKKGTTVYSLKTLLSSTVKKNGKHENYLALTKSLLLEAGDYYFCVESTNAKKGGSADYTVNLDTGESVFFTKGKNNDDCDDLAEKGAAGKVVKFGEIKNNTTKILSDWVGYGDAIDYRQFTIKSNASVRFEISADDAAKFTVYQLVGKTDKKGVTTYSLKTLQTTKLHEFETLTTKSLKLDAGEYYFSMESTNAAKGGNASYDIYLIEFSALPQKGKDADALAMPDEENEWNSLADSIVSSGLILTGEASSCSGSGYVRLSGGDLADLAMPGVDDVSASPIPVAASDDLFEGLSDTGKKTPDLLA